MAKTVKTSARCKRCGQIIRLHRDGTFITHKNGSTKNCGKSNKKP